MAEYKPKDKPKPKSKGKDVPVTAAVEVSEHQVTVMAMLDDYSMKHSGEGGERIDWVRITIRVDSDALTDIDLVKLVRACKGNPLSFVIESHAPGQPKFEGYTAINGIDFKSVGKTPLQSGVFTLDVPAEAIDPRWDGFRKATRHCGATISLTPVQRNLFDK